MKFSRSTTYGLRALGNLLSSRADRVGRVKSLKIIAEEENISLKFLEKLFSQLKRAGIVESLRGANGGYYLKKKASQVDLLQVLEALGENIAVFSCVVGLNGKIKCLHGKNCGAVPVLKKVQGAINKSLEKMTLEDLIN